ncbi:12835_t:CDS:2, partial [Dentiscutata erythropus]
MNNHIKEYYYFNTSINKYSCKKCGKFLKISSTNEMTEHVIKCFQKEIKEINDSGINNEIALHYDFVTQFTNDKTHKILKEFTVDKVTKNLVCNKCNHTYSPNLQIFTLKKHFMDIHPDDWNEIKKDNKKQKVSDEKNNANDSEIKKLLIKYHQELLRIKEDEIKKLKEKITNGELELLDLLVEKVKNRETFIIVVVKQSELPTSETEFINIFLKENLEQLNKYKSLFKYISDDDDEKEKAYVVICQQDICERYLPLVEQSINDKYEAIKENHHV